MVAVVVEGSEVDSAVARVVGEEAGWAVDWAVVMVVG